MIICFWKHAFKSFRLHLTLLPFPAPLCHTLTQVSAPTPPLTPLLQQLKCSFRNILPNYIAVLFIQLAYGEAKLVRWWGMEKHSSGAAQRLLKWALSKAAQEGGMAPRRGCKEGNCQPCIKPAAARHRHLACTIPTVWLRGRHEMWLLEISSSLSGDLAEFYWLLLW